MVLCVGMQNYAGLKIFSAQIQFVYCIRGNIVDFLKLMKEIRPTFKRGKEDERDREINRKKIIDPRRKQTWTKTDDVSTH